MEENGREDGGAKIWHEVLMGGLEKWLLEWDEQRVVVPALAEPVDATLCLCKYRRDERVKVDGDEQGGGDDQVTKNDSGARLIKNILMIIMNQDNDNGLTTAAWTTATSTIAILALTISLTHTL